VIRNFTKPTPIHAERIRIGFSYNDPPNLARQVLKSTAWETKGILLDPPPEVFTISYDDSSVCYEVKFFIRDYGDIEQIRERFVTRVWYAAKRNNLTIPFPIRTLYHFHGPTSRAEGTSKKFAESLQSIPSFVPLDNPDNIQNLSQDITLKHFGTGEKVMQQGYASNALYIAIAGQAMMTVIDKNDREQEVLPIKAGEFFGEMTLFSGEPSTVSVTAVEDLEVMMISAAEVNQMIERQPSFAREISQVLEIRRRAVQRALQQPFTGVK
jgi:hypothetical protein